MNRQDLTGQRFGRLIVLGFAKSNNGAMWNCICDCGNKTVVQGKNLRRSLKPTRSCGCFGRECSRKRPYEGVYNLLLRQEKSPQGHQVIISYEDFLEFVNIKNCHYCTKSIELVLYNPYRKNRSKGYNLDRKNNNEPYIKSNCVVCCGKCNRAKGNRYTYEQWYKMTEPFRTGELKL